MGMLCSMKFDVSMYGDVVFNEIRCISLCSPPFDTLLSGVRVDIDVAGQLSDAGDSLSTSFISYRTPFVHSISLLSMDTPTVRFAVQCKS